MKTIKASFVRNHIAETWEMARQELVTVENYGQPEFVIVSINEYLRISAPRNPRRAGFAKEMLEGVDVDALMETSIPGISEYVPH